MQVPGSLEPPRGFAGEAKRLESGLRFEVEQGFQNRQGREMQFDAFLVRQQAQHGCLSRSSLQIALPSIPCLRKLLSFLSG